MTPPFIVAVDEAQLRAAAGGRLIGLAASAVNGSAPAASGVAAWLGMDWVQLGGGAAG